MRKKKNVWIYCCMEPSEDVYLKLKRQRERLNDYAKEMGFCVVGFSSDVANGVGKARLGWKYLIQTVSEQPMDALLVHSLSQIHVDTCQALGILEQLKRKGVTVYSQLEGKLDFGFQSIIGRMEEIK